MPRLFYTTYIYINPVARPLNHRCFGRPRGIFLFILFTGTILPILLSALQTWPAHSILAPFLNIELYFLFHLNVLVAQLFFLPAHECQSYRRVHIFSLKFFSQRYLVYSHFLLMLLRFRQQVRIRHNQSKIHGIELNSLDNYLYTYVKLNQAI